MRANIATAAFFILCFFVFGFMFSSCAAVGETDYFGYVSRDFDAKMHGQIDGDEVSLTLKNRRGADGGNSVTLIFDSPKALDGVVLSRSDTGEYEARLGELILHDFNAEGLFEPFLTLLHSREIASIKKDSEGRAIINVKQGEVDLEYVFSDKITHPHSIKGRVGERNIELFVDSLDFI